MLTNVKVDPSAAAPSMASGHPKIALISAKPNAAGGHPDPA